MIRTYRRSLFIPTFLHNQNLHNQNSPRQPSVEHSYDNQGRCIGSVCPSRNVQEIHSLPVRFRLRRSRPLQRPPYPSLRARTQLHFSLECFRSDSLTLSSILPQLTNNDGETVAVLSRGTSCADQRYFDRALRGPSVADLTGTFEISPVGFPSHHATRSR